jgi:hypothetical protein
MVSLETALASGKQDFAVSREPCSGTLLHVTDQIHYLESGNQAAEDGIPGSYWTGGDTTDQLRPYKTILFFI